MAYLAFDLDALESGANAARASGVHDDVVFGGLLRMWAWCWREKKDLLEPLHVRGFFAAPQDCAPALLAFGFLELVGGQYRVCGASRYLRIRQAQSEAGKAQAKNLKKGRSTSGSSRGRAGKELESTSGSGPALSASSEQRAANSEVKSIAAAPPRPSDELCADFLAATGKPYAWAGAKDGVALAELLKVADLAEVRRRWRIGLRATGWRQAATVAQLRSKWNDLALADAPRKGGAHTNGSGATDWSDVPEGYTGADWIAEACGLPRGVK